MMIFIENGGAFGGSGLPKLQRGYSDQKRHYFKELSRIIFKNIRDLESNFDFKKLIERQKEIEK